MADKARYGTLDEELIAKIKAFEQRADSLKASLEPLTALTRKDLKKYGPFTRAKLTLATAYAGVCLHVMRLRANGEIMNNQHPVQLALGRVKEYFTKIQAAIPEEKRVRAGKEQRRGEKRARETAKEEEAAGSMPSMEERTTTVDKASFKRLVEHQKSQHRVQDKIEQNAAEKAAIDQEAEDLLNDVMGDDDVEEIEEIEEVEEEEEEAPATLPTNARGAEGQPARKRQKK